jgi:hypothetical protein
VGTPTEEQHAAQKIMGEKLKEFKAATILPAVGPETISALPARRGNFSVTNFGHPHTEENK